jgi:hypothetical protein
MGILIAAMAGYESARFNLGCIEYNSGNMERAIKHWTISASAGCRDSMMAIQSEFEREIVQTDLFELGGIGSKTHWCRVILCPVSNAKNIGSIRSPSTSPINF